MRRSMPPPFHAGLGWAVRGRSGGTPKCPGLRRSVGARVAVGAVRGHTCGARKGQDAAMTSGSPRAAITAMWAWDNPVPPAQDPRGRGYVPAAADRLAAFARAGELREVYLLAPSGTASGPVEAWLADAVGALHDVGVQGSAVAGGGRATADWGGADGKRVG